MKKRNEEKREDDQTGLKWWNLKTDRVTTVKESKSALQAASDPEFWKSLDKNPSAQQGEVKGATFVTIPGALIAAAISAKCEISLLVPICLIVRLKKRASFRVRRADLAGFIGVGEQTIGRYIQQYVEAGILRVPNKVDGKPIKITVCAKNKEELIAQGIACCHSGRYEGSPLPTIRKNRTRKKSERK